MLFVGNDWAEAHHDVEIVDQEGRILARRRLPEGVAGIAALHELVADHLGEADEPGQVLVGIETDRGPWFQALVAAGYTVYPINPLQVARYRERHGVGGAKSDPGDAHVLAEIVRLDRAHHRSAAGDSELAEHVRLAARAHQTMIWTRQRSTNTLRSLLREFYPAALEAFGDDLAGRDALAVLAAAPNPDRGRRLTPARVAGLLRKAGRQRNADTRAAAIVAALHAEQLSARPGVVPAYAASVSALVAVITEMVRQTAVLEEQVKQGFGQHPDAEIYLSQPGMGTIIAARVLAEMGDDPHRYTDARARKNYAGMATHHPRLRHQTRRASPPRPQPAPRRRALPARVQRPDQLSWRPRLLRPATSPPSNPSPSPTGPRQPARRHPPRLPTPPHPLRREHRLGSPAPTRRLTPSTRGMSPLCPRPGADSARLRATRR